MKVRREFKPSARVYSPTATFERPKRAQKRAIPRWTKWLIGLLITFAAVVGLLWLPQIRIISVTVQGARIEDPSEIQAIALAQLEGRYFGIVPRNSIFFYPGDAIRQKIQDGYPRIADISVHYRTATSIGIYFEERKPAALWCGAGSACAFLDSDGFAFARAPRFSGAVFFEIGATSTEPALRAFVVPSEEFTSILRLRQDVAMMLQRNFPQYGTPVGVLADSESSLVFRIQYPDGASEWKLIVKRGDVPVELLRNIELGLQSLRDDPKNTGKTLDYLDVRLGQKLFSKFKE